MEKSAASTESEDMVQKGMRADVYAVIGHRTKVPLE